MGSSATISAEYLEQQRQLHQNQQYGTASLLFAPLVQAIMRYGRLRSIADYGAGKQNLKRGLEALGSEAFEYRPYDPAFPEYGAAETADLVCCIDVLEHIEPDRLDSVFADLERITTRLGFFSIHTGPAVKVLSDGRNAHLIQEPASWWLPRLCERFEVRHLQALPNGFWVLVEPRGSAQSTIDPVDLTRLGRETRDVFSPAPRSRWARLVRNVRRIAKNR